MIAALRYREFRNLWVGFAFLVTGFWMHSLITWVRSPILRSADALPSGQAAA